MPRPSISVPRKKDARRPRARVPSIGREEFKRRRRALLKQMGRDSIAIVPTAPVRLRNNDVEYAYRPDSDFFYLTGFAEPESVAVLVPGRPQGEYILFVRDRDPARETWDGRRAGPDGRHARLRRRRRLSDRRHRRDPARACSRTAPRCSTPWARIRSSTSAWSAG